MVIVILKKFSGNPYIHSFGTTPTIELNVVAYILDQISENYLAEVNYISSLISRHSFWQIHWLQVQNLFMFCSVFLMLLVRSVPWVRGSQKMHPKFQGKLENAPKISGKSENAPNISGKSENTPKVSGEVGKGTKMSGKSENSNWVSCWEPCYIQCNSFSGALLYYTGSDEINEDDNLLVASLRLLVLGHTEVRVNHSEGEWEFVCRQPTNPSLWQFVCGQHATPISRTRWSPGIHRQGEWQNKNMLCYAMLC